MEIRKDAKTVIWAVSATAIVVVAVLFPSSGLAATALQSLGVWVIAAALYRRTCAVSAGGYAVLSVLWGMLMCGCSVNAWWFSTAAGTTPEAPVLLNFDANRSWELLQSLLKGTEAHYVPLSWGYSIVLALLSWGSTPDIGSLLCLNALAILAAVILTAVATSRMICGDRTEASARTARNAMIVLGAMSYFLVAGTILIKDAFCCLLTASLLYSMVCVDTLWKRLAGMLLCAGVGLLIRDKLPLFMAMAVLSMCVFTRRHRVAYVLTAVVMLAGSLALYYCYPSEIIAPDGTTSFYVGDHSGSRLAAYNLIAGDYSASSGANILYIITHLPFTLAVQYLIPLPWAFGRDIVFGPTEAWAHFSFPWYALGGVLLYILIFRLRHLHREVLAAYVFAAIAFVLTAAATGGTVSRYCLPWLPFFIPAAVQVLESAELRTRRFKIWAVSYVVLLAAALATVFYFLNAYSPGGWVAS